MNYKRIEKEVKKFLKINKTFKQVKTFEEATAVLVFLKSNLSQFNIILKEEVNNKELFDNPLEDIVQIYLKHTNPHDRKNATMGFIKMIPACKRRY